MRHSSKHKSHRDRKRDAPSDSEEGDSKARKTRVEEVPAPRVSKVLEHERKKKSGKDSAGIGSGEEHGKKRRDRVDDAAAAVDRWDGGEAPPDGSPEKRTKADEIILVDTEKAGTGRSKASASDTKVKLSRKHDTSAEKNEENGNKAELNKHRLGKELSKNSGSQHKDTKERDRDKERGSDRDREKRLQDSKLEKPEESKKERSKRDDEERKRTVESADWQIPDELRNLELEKELEKRIGKSKDGSGDKDRGVGDRKDTDDRRLSTRENHTKSGGFSDVKQKDGSHRDRYREDHDREQRQRVDRSVRDEKERRDRDDRTSKDERDQRHREDERNHRHRDDHASRDERDQRHRDEKHRDDRSSRDHLIDRSDNKQFREEKKLSEEKKVSESRYKKNKYPENNHDANSHLDEHNAKYRSGRKRFSDENDDYIDPKLRSAKEPRLDGKPGVNTVKFDHHVDRTRTDNPRVDKADPSASNHRRKNSPSSGAYAKDQVRRPKQVEPSQNVSPSEERLQYGTLSTRDPSQSHSFRKTMPKEDNYYSSDLYIENNTVSQSDRTPRSDCRVPLNQQKDRSPSMNDRRVLNRSNASRSIEIEDPGHQSFKDVKAHSSAGEPSENMPMSFRSEAELSKIENGPTSLASHNRSSSHIVSTSPSRLPPPPPIKSGVDSPSVLGSYDDDRFQNIDRKSNGRYKRPNDLNIGRGPGNSWKGTPSWHSSVPNGFMHLQRGPTGFHPNIQQFPGPHMFGVRTPLDMTHAGVAFHVHDTADRFSSHGRHFGWRNPADDPCPPHFQMWDGSGGMFGDEPHLYGRPEWDQNRHLMVNKGWDMNPDSWNGPIGNINAELSIPLKETVVSRDLAAEAHGGQFGNWDRNEKAKPHHAQDEDVDVQILNDVSVAKNITASSSGNLRNGKIESVKVKSAPKPSAEERLHLLRCCLSKIDISADLTHPELYKQCMSILGNKDATDVFPKHAVHQDDKKENPIEAERSSRLLKILFPPSAKREEVFRKSMALYEKIKSQRLRLTKKGTTVAGPVVLPDSLKSSEASDSGKVETVECHTNDVPLTDANLSGGMLSNAEHISPKEENVANNAKACAFGNTTEIDSDSVSDAAVCVEGSQPCEAAAIIAPECMVNLSRIPNSPESTH